MTEAERQQLQQVSDKTDAMYRAFMEPGPDGQPSMIERISTVVLSAERGSWAAKWTVRIILTVGAVLGVFASLNNWWSE